MNKMRFLMVPVLWAAMALPAAAEKLSLGEISSYLNRLKTAQGAFTQVNEDGQEEFVIIEEYVVEENGEVVPE